MSNSLKNNIALKPVLIASSCILIVAIVLFALNSQVSDQPLSFNAQNLELCYNDDISNLYFPEFKQKKFSQSNLFEISHLIQKTHTDLFNAYVDLEKRAYVAKKYKVKTFDGIPTYEEIFGDRLRISDVEIGEFLDKNPDLLSGAQATDREKRRAVRNYLYGTKIKEKKDEHL